MSTGKILGNSSVSEIHKLSRDYCCMFRIRLVGLNSKTSIDHPISASKCRHLYGKLTDDWILDNGRIVSAIALETTCTEQDLFTYEQFYSWDECQIFDLVVYRKQYLPTPFVKAILNLYKMKTELKDVPDRLVDYMVSKNMLNAAYGMTVTNIVREVLTYTEDDEYVSNYDSDDFNIEKFLESQISKYNSNRRRFLFYPWGVWVTAYARANLFSGILASGRDYIYSDTDSIKILNPSAHENYIKAYNSEIEEKLRLACEFHNIPFSMTKPKNKYGKEKPLGVWDFEGIYDEFKTLGAKRYLWRKGDKWQLTVAGVNKFKGMQYLLLKSKEENCSPFDLFHLDEYGDGALVIPQEYSGRMILTYGHDEIVGMVKDYLGQPYQYRELSYIHMEPSDYTMDTIVSFIKFLQGVREDSW